FKSPCNSRSLSSSTASSRLPFVGAPWSLSRSSPPAFASFLAGSSTTNWYLHLGQSAFLPIILGSRIVTAAWQLGHFCLKVVDTAMSGISRSKLSAPNRRQSNVRCYRNANEGPNRSQASIEEAAKDHTLENR